ncbi:MAG: GerAB/ArcD/ProY family transporter [Sporolactobacillus sp.]
MKPISDSRKVGPLAAFFIPQVMQIGMGFLSFQHIVTSYSGNDAWLSTLIAGLGTLLPMWVILRLLQNDRSCGQQPDLFSIHHHLFGRHVGNVLSFIIVLHTFLFAVAFLRGYIEILQVFLFPQLPMIVFSGLFIFIVWYVVMGGIRSIYGVCLLSFIYLLPLVALTMLAIPNVHLENLLPLFNHRPGQILTGVYMETHDYLGFELLIYVFPFIKSPKDAKKWAYFALLATLYFYMSLMIITSAFFTNGRLAQMIWPTLTLWKNINFPLIEHVGIVCIVILLWNLIPNVSLCMWITARFFKSACPAIKMKYSLLPLLALLVIAVEFIKNGPQVAWVNRLYSNSGFFIVYIYFPLLLLIQWIKKKIRGKDS